MLAVSSITGLFTEAEMLRPISHQRLHSLPLHPPSTGEVSSNAALLDYNHEALHAHPRLAASSGTLRRMLMVVFFEKPAVAVQCYYWS